MHQNREQWHWTVYHLCGVKPVVIQRYAPYTKWNRITIHNTQINLLHAVAWIMLSASTLFPFFHFSQTWGRMADRLRVRDHDAESGLRMIAQCGASFHRTGTSFRRRISLAIYKAAWTHFVFIFVNLSFQLMMSMSCSSKYFAMWCTRYGRAYCSISIYLFIIRRRTGTTTTTAMKYEWNYSN